MPYKPYSRDEAEQIYSTRPPIENEGFTMARMRVAILIVRKQYRRKPHKQKIGAFCLWYLEYLDKYKRKYGPHPLQWEILAALKGLQQGSTGAQVYAELLRGRGKRIVHKVAYGGRRDQR